MERATTKEATSSQHSDDEIFQAMQPAPELDFVGGHTHNQSVDEYIEELLNGTLACTHTHVCNPPGPDQEHTHSCQHTHTRLLTPPVLPAESEAEDQKSSEKGTESASGSRKRKPIPPASNREAVRKYRERKKAHTEYLEGEVERLQSINAQLVKRLQGQTAMAAELRRLRGLLSDLHRTLNREMQAPSALGGLMDSPGTPMSPHDFFTTSVEVPCQQDIDCLHQPRASKRLHAPGARRPDEAPIMIAHANVRVGLGPIPVHAASGLISGGACKADMHAVAGSGGSPDGQHYL